MQDKQLIDRLRGMSTAEPPLGFDPDQVADTAARLHRRRRATLAAGGGTLAAVAAVAVTVSMVLAGQGAIGSAGQAGPLTGLSQPPLVSPKVDLSKQKQRNEELLKEVLPKLKPGVTQLRTTMRQLFHDGDLDALSGIAGFRDEVHGAWITLSITGPITARSVVTPLPLRCVPRGEGSVVPTSHQYNPAGDTRPSPRKGLTGKCEKLPQPDGSVVVVEEVLTPKDPMAPNSFDSQNPADYKRISLDGTHYRLDGSVVGVQNLVTVPSDFTENNDAGQNRPDPPLTRDQVIQLVTNPEFNLS
ncbi:hypothetical protein [Crossiella sp. NPDC003009]